MADKEAPVSIIQNSFAAGELSPKLYGRTDLQKYQSGCAVLQNFYVDYKGGATTRPGTQYIGEFGSAGRGRLIPFMFSPTIGQTYILAFSDQVLRFVKNPGTAAYPNSSNAGLIFDGMNPYEVVTPYLEADLRNISYLQIADVMWLTCRGHPRKKLSRVSDTNWTLTDVSIDPAIGAPTITAVEISALPSGSTDPEETRYMYAVSAVDEEGDESLPSVPFISDAGINIASTQGTVTIRWDPVDGAKFYKIYKALPTHGDKVPNQSEQLGFLGFSYGTVFTDSNIVADFANAPLQAADPFAEAPIIGYEINDPGTGYPVSGTTLTVTDVDGSGAVLYPILDTNDAGGTGGIVGIYIANPGSGYTAPTVSAAGGGADFDATLEVGPDTGITPAVVGISQQRLVYASTENKPNTVFASRPGSTDDFRKSNPVVDNDAFEFAIFDQQVTSIVWLRSMPGGLVIGTDAGVVQLTGGSSSASNPAAITPTNAVVVPQSGYGAAMVPPIVIDYDILYVQTEGSVIRDLQYNFFVNTYTGTDLTVLSSHLFEGHTVVEWAYQDAPCKVVWAVRDDGIMPSLTFLKAQELIGWSWNDTQGKYESVAVVQEGDMDAVYFSVNRNGTRMIERASSQIFYQKSDAWQLDSALSITSTFPNADITLEAGTGTNVLVTASAAVFVGGDVGKQLSALGGRATVVSFSSNTQIRVNIDLAFPSIPGSGAFEFEEDTWRLDPEVETITGLDHLEGREVYALVDGEVQGPFTVSGGEIELTEPGFQVVVGLQYTCRLQPLYLDVGGDTTIQGLRKKITAASVRVQNAAGLEYGISFSDLKEWRAGVSSTDPRLSLPYTANGLFTGDQRMILNQEFTVGGWVCIEQSKPLPATILAVIPEVAQGDTR